MRESLKDICSEALNTYGTMYRVEWLLSWPGMIAICCNFIKWTAEVTEALSKGKVQVNNLFRITLNAFQNVTFIFIFVSIFVITLP